MTKKNILGAIALLVVGFILGVLGMRQLQSNNALGAVSYDVQKFVGDIYNGINDTKIFSGGFFVGPVNTSATSTFSGFTYIKSLIPATGVTTITPGATTTITAAQICSGGGTIQWAPSVANASATLPTADSLRQSCLSTTGNRIDVRFRNTSTTSSYILVAGSGTTIYHVAEVATSTAQNNSISSSTPAMVTFQLTLASSTDSTASADVVKLITP